MNDGTNFTLFLRDWFDQYAAATAETSGWSINLSRADWPWKVRVTLGDVTVIQRLPGGMGDPIDDIFASIKKATEEAIAMGQKVLLAGKLANGIYIGRAGKWNKWRSP